MKTYSIQEKLLLALLLVLFLFPTIVLAQVSSAEDTSRLHISKPIPTQIQSPPATENFPATESLCSGTVSINGCSGVQTINRNQVQSDSYFAYNYYGSGNIACIAYADATCNITPIGWALCLNNTLDVPFLYTSTFTRSSDFSCAGITALQASRILWIMEHAAAYGINVNTAIGRIDLNNAVWQITNPTAFPCTAICNAATRNVTTPYNDIGCRLTFLCPNNTTTQAMVIYSPAFGGNYQADPSVSLTNATCGLANGSVNITNLTAGYSSNIDGGVWTLGQTSYTGLAAGTHIVGVGVAGCNRFTTFTIASSTPPSVGGSVSGTNTVCATNNNFAAAYFTLSGYTGTVVRWEWSTDNATWHNWGGAGSSTSPSNSIAYATNYYVRVLVQNGSCEAVYSTTKLVEVKPVLNAVSVTVDNDSVCVGGTSVFAAVLPNGFSNVSYQWQSSSDNTTFSDIIGAISSTYSAPTSLAGLVYYRVVATDTQNNCGTATSTATTVTVVSDPLTPSMSNITECVGGILQLNATAIGGARAIAYQWQSSTNNMTFNNIVGATAAVYQPPSAVAGTTYYRVLASAAGSGCDVAAPQMATVTVVADPIITTQPANISECVGGVQFIAVAAMGGIGTLNYQWQSSSDNITFTDIAGATDTVYTPPSVSAGIRYYRAVVSQPTNGCNTLISSTSTFIVVPDPVLAVSSPTTTICIGTNITMTANLSGGIGCTSQWQSSPNNATWTDIIGATGNTYSTPMLSNSLYYRVKLVCSGSGCCN